MVQEDVSGLFGRGDGEGVLLDDELSMLLPVQDDCEFALPRHVAALVDEVADEGFVPRKQKHSDSIIFPRREDLSNQRIAFDKLEYFVLLVSPFYHYLDGF